MTPQPHVETPPASAVIPAVAGSLARYAAGGLTFWLAQRSITLPDGTNEAVVSALAAMIVAGLTLGWIWINKVMDEAAKQAAALLAQRREAVATVMPRNTEPQQVTAVMDAVAPTLSPAATAAEFKEAVTAVTDTLSPKAAASAVTVTAAVEKATK